MRRRKEKNPIKTILKVFGIMFAFMFFMQLFFPYFERANPDERNHISFRHDKIDNVIDSIISFRIMLQSYSLPEYVNTNEVLIRTRDGELEINEEPLGKFNFENIRKTWMFNRLSDGEIVRFMTMIKYLYNNDLNRISYDSVSYTCEFDYKDIYEMHGCYPDGGYERWLVYDEHLTSKYYLLGYKLLDSCKSLYLFASNRYDIKRDNVPYKRNNEK